MIAPAGRFFFVLISTQNISYICFPIPFNMKDNEVIEYTDPILLELRLELANLENELIAAENQINEAERLISQYNHYFYKELGDILSEILKRKRDYHDAHKQESKYSEAEYEGAKQQYEEFSSERETIEKIDYCELGDAEKEELRKLYRQATKKCHPDLNPDKEAEAQRITVELNEAYSRSDLKRVREIYEQVEKGLFKNAQVQYNDIEALKTKVAQLRIKLTDATHKLNTLLETDEYKIMMEAGDITGYFSQKRTELEKELDYWKNAADGRN